MKPTAKASKRSGRARFLGRAVEFHRGKSATLTRYLAQELGRRGIRVVGVSPGYTLTPATSGLDRDVADLLVSRTALRRAGRPNDIVSVVAFLASDDGAGSPERHRRSATHTERCSTRIQKDTPGPGAARDRRFTGQGFPEIGRQRATVERMPPRAADIEQTQTFCRKSADQLVGNKRDLVIAKFVKLMKILHLRWWAHTGSNCGPAD